MTQPGNPSPVRSFSLRKKIVLFVSTGDTCRSPMAAGYFRRLLSERNIRGVDVRAAGVMTVTGLRASQEAQQVMEAVEVDLTRHRSSQLTPEAIRRADLILGMSPLHVQHALRESPDARGKTFLLKEFARSDLKNIQISDPMGCTLEVFKKCFKEIRQACDKLVETDYVKALIPPAERDRPRITQAEAAAKAAAAKKESMADDEDADESPTPEKKAKPEKKKPAEAKKAPAKRPARAASPAPRKKTSPARSRAVSKKSKTTKKK